MPTEAPYPPPLDQLLHLGDPRKKKDIQARIAALGLTQAHVPDLVRMARDRALNTAWSDADEVWGPIHAMTALEQLDASAVVPDLIPLFDIDSEWHESALPSILGQAGAVALEPLRAYLGDRGRWVWGRVGAAETIKAIGKRFPELRDEAVRLLTDELRQGGENDPIMNGSLLAGLLELKAVEALPVIRAALEKNQIDESIAGGWPEVLKELGVKADPDDPLLKKPPFRPGWPLGFLERDERGLPSPPPLPRLPAVQTVPKKGDKAKQKQKRKQADASRKANRAKKRK